jgi:hypothetical protein
MEYRIVTNNDTYRVQAFFRPLLWPFKKRWITLCRTIYPFVDFVWPTESPVEFKSKEEAEEFIAKTRKCEEIQKRPFVICDI